MAEEDDEATLEEEMRARRRRRARTRKTPARRLMTSQRTRRCPSRSCWRGTARWKPPPSGRAAAGKGTEPGAPSDEGREDDGDATFADIVEDGVAPRGPSAEDEDEYAVGEGEDEEDDEATLEEEMRAAAAGEDEEDAGAEINDLAKDAEVPIEELVRRYREMEAEHDAATAVGAERAAFQDDEVEDGDGDGGDEDGDGSGDEDDEPGVASLVDENAADAMTAEEKAASDARRRVLDNLAGDADALQPKGNTLSSADVKCRVPFLLKHRLREYQHVGLTGSSPVTTKP